jgi:hypothetical protein
MAALIAAARWVAEGAEGEIAEEAVDQLRQILANYDENLQRIGSGPSGSSGNGSGDGSSSLDPGPAPPPP